jgi:hypothetical protein
MHGTCKGVSFRVFLRILHGRHPDQAFPGKSVEKWPFFSHSPANRGKIGGFLSELPLFQAGGSISRNPLKTG